MVHIYGHSWPIRWGGEGDQKMVKVYSNADEAELFLNGGAPEFASGVVRTFRQRDFAGISFFDLGKILFVSWRGREGDRDRLAVFYLSDADLG